MRVLAYSDIHICHSWPLISLEDIEAVHDRVCQYASENKPDLVLFLGDRFRARQPKDHVRAAADRGFRRMSDEVRAYGGAFAVLVGNHDRYSESVGSGNTYSSLKVFADVMPSTLLMERPGTYTIREDLLIHALPAGYAFDRRLYLPNPACINIFAFHGLIHGAVYDQLGNIEIKSGVSMSDLDDSTWDVVIGGDVHVPQVFPLKNTIGGYVGSTLRLNEGDAGDERGFLDITGLDTYRNPDRRNIKFVEAGGPKFVKLDLTHDMTTWPDPMAFTSAILIISLSGPASELRKVSDQQIKEIFAPCRAVEIHRHPDHEIPKIVEGINAKSTFIEDILSYIKASDKDGFDEDRLIAKAMTLIDTPIVQKRGLFK